MNKPHRILSLIFFFLCASVMAEEPVHTAISFYSEVGWIQPGSPFWVGIKMAMDPGWHTYWINPGDAGGPIQMRWDLPARFQVEPAPFPTPERIETPPLATFGYTGEVVLLAKILPPPAIDRPEARIGLNVRWLECADVCIPREKKLALSPPVKNITPSADPSLTGFFADARSRIPLSSDEWSVRGEDAGKIIRLILSPPAWVPRDPGDVFFFPKERGLIDNFGLQNTFVKRHQIIQVIPKSKLSTGTVAHLTGVLRSSRGWRGPGSEKGLSLSVSVSPSSASTPSVFTIFLFALLGGLLLNVMPCVLPVLSIKVFGFLKEKDSAAANLRRHGLFYTLGILLTFWALAGFILLLKAGGKNLGWGFQLQDSRFVAFLAYLFTILALNFFGVFEWGESFGRWGDKIPKGPLAGQESLQAVLTGILATLVATPCTAPFMGTAMGYALAQPAPLTLFVFSGLGLGLAFPYLLLCFYPGAGRWLPRPGEWMNRVKQAMGFLLIGTVVWLLWVLGRQTSLDFVIRLLAGLAAVGLASWVYSFGQNPALRKSVKIGIRLAAVVLLVSSFLWAVRSVQSPTVGSDGIASENDLTWEPFSPSLVEQRRKENRLVFVDFTAAWCLTCQVNERIVFSDKAVLERVKKWNVALVRGDWTNGNDLITAELSRHQRSGVPFYLLYPGESDPILLPELLTPTIFLDKLSEARNRLKIAPSKT